MVAIRFVGGAPDFAEGTQVVLEDEVRKGILISFEDQGSGTVAIRHAGPDSAGDVYRVDPESTLEELVLVRTNTGGREVDPRETPDLERSLREALSNAAFFYRDADLDDALPVKYRPGMLLQERAFVDCTHLRGGLAARHRFLIVTGEARDLHALAGMDPKYGPAIIARDGFFKVLDVRESGGRAQITLLHLPEGPLEKLGSETGLSDLEREIAAAARGDFEESLNAPVVPALAEPEWLARVAFPIGMSDEGEPFAVRWAEETD